MKKNRSEKKGVSPVIATVLLVAMVVVIALIIFLWFRRIGGETITKFGGENIELTCQKVEFTADYYNGELSIVNDGNIPIFGMKIKIVGGGSRESMDLEDISTWPDKGLAQGGSYSEDISSYTGSAESIILTPVLLGTSEKGERTHTCDEKQNSYEIEVF